MTDPNQKIADDELKLVKGLIQDFLQSLKSYQIYEPEHPILSKFLDRLKQDFDAYFEKNDHLVFEVDEFHFLFNGKAVYESPNVRESLAFMFFKDGIREVQFFRGLDLNEIIDFLTLIRKSNIVNRMEDDLVTLFWNKDFLHIDFTVVDDFFEGGLTLIPMTEEDLIRRLEYRGFETLEIEEYGPTETELKSETDSVSGSGSGWGGGKGSGGGFGKGIGSGSGQDDRGAHGGGSGDRKERGGGSGEEATSERLRRGGSGGESVLDLTLKGASGNASSLVANALKPFSPDKTIGQICALTSEEIEEIYRRANKEEQMETLYGLINNFTEILLHLGKNTKTYDNIVSYFDRILKSLLESGEVEKTVAILRNFHDSAEKIPLNGKQEDTIDRILQIASDSQSISLMGKIMQANNESDREFITEYLQMIRPKGVDPLCLLLRTLEADRWRKVIRERLVDLCQDEIRPLVKFLSEPKASFISDLIYVLGKVRHPSTVEYLNTMTRHEDMKVREDVLRLAAVFGEKGKDIVRKFLYDSASGIRGKAALIFAKIEKEEAAVVLAQIILSEDFHMRPYDEKVSFFKALRETQSPMVVPVLEQIIKKKIWFKKAQWEEMRTCAANTLKMVKGSDDAGT